MVDLTRFNDTITSIYDTVLDRRRWPEAMRLVVELCGGHGGMIAVADPFNGTVAYTAWHGIDFDQQRLLDQRYADINPVAFVPYFAEVGGICSVQTTMEPRAWLSSKFYREWAGPQRFVDAICLVTAKTTTRYCMALVLSDHKATDDDVEALQLLGPHLRRALDIGQLVETSVGEVRDLAAMLGALPTAAFLLDESRTIVRTNPAGERMLEDASHLRRDHGRLAAALPLADASIVSALGDIGRRQGPDSGVSVPLGDGPKMPTALVMPLRGEAAAGKASAALFVQPPQQSLQLPPELLARRYGLTSAELRVILWIAAGRSVGEIAEFSSTSMNTVRTHLRALYAKTGVHRQSALVRLALSASPEIAPM